MAKEKAISYPSTEGEVPAYYNNAYMQLTTKGLATKYGIDAASLAKLDNHNKNIVTTRNDATAADTASLAAHSTKDTEFHDAKTDMLTVLGTINRSPILTETDADALGMRKSHTPPDPDTAKPKISHVTLLSDKIIFDWVKGPWKGVVIYGSYDGINFEKLDKDFRSPFEDERKNKVDHTPENRFYKLRYIDSHDKEIGLESDVAKVVTQIY